MLFSIRWELREQLCVYALQCGWFHEEVSDGHITRFLMQHFRELCYIELFERTAEIKVDTLTLD